MKNTTKRELIELFLGEDLTKADLILLFKQVVGLLAMLTVITLLS
jgi:hypothetical protein